MADASSERASRGPWPYGKRRPHPYSSLARLGRTVSRLWLVAVERQRALLIIPLLAIATLYLALVLWHLATITTNIEISADVTAAQVTTELFSHSTGFVVLGDIGGYSTFIYQLVTKWLPAHREVWDVGPYVIALLTITVMAWTASKVAGRLAACITTALLVCACPTMLEQMFWLNNHMTTYYSLAILVALAVFLEDRAATARRRILALVVFAVGIPLGINMASDPLFLFYGPGLLMLACATAWLLNRTAATRAVVGWCAIAAAVMVVSGVTTTAIMHSQDIYQAPFALAFATSEAISTNFRDWWESIALLGNGSFFGARLSSVTALAVVSSALTVGAVLWMPNFTFKGLQSWRSERDATDPRTVVYLVFWTSSTVVLSAAFILSSAPVGLATSRYLDGLLFAAAAVVPLYARRSQLGNLAVVLGSLTFCVASTIALLESKLLRQPTKGPTPAVAADVTRTAERFHATQGYAVYWGSAPLTWFSHMRIKAYPFFGCLNNNMCPPQSYWRPSWYELPRGERTFLISEDEFAYPPQPEFGKPLASYRFGTITMTIYDHNIGQNFK
jgi:hypothetical protein